ncbi:branched-chain amino acid transport system substrate-binding protein [Chitinivorax tropicus]|uniref:Branched-chain amino acid transport system substrate-binding protein n=1 Tax=Chitinivorax tropicus TaxID=714531 RepID=A0A840MX92_9PROT|nr:branched-chain amino acid ABC transporter substrate-binding protein [Chitinivorax tropicus]MBB5019771.1 branched-chain amino acid transport system substrate-binding protein [Chitinivorax tropicus]
MHYSTLRTLGLAVTAALAITACGKKAEQQAGQASTPASAPAVAGDSDVIKLGFAGPLTGPQAHYGADMKNGILLAIEDANAQKLEIGGKKIKFELVAEDDQADPKTGAQMAQRLVDAKVSGVIGHFNSGTSIPASKIYSDAGLPQIAMATAPAYTQQGFKTTFRAMTSDTQQGGVMGPFVVNKLGLKKIAIIDDRTAYGQGLADEFEKSAKTAGGQIVKREFTNDKATDFTAILTAIKASQPDAIFYGGADAQSAPLAKQLKRLGLKATLVSGEMTRTSTFLQLAGAEAEGVVASLAGVPMDKMPGGKDFESRVKAKFGSMELYSPYSYDATMTMIAAMKKANSTDPVKYLPELAKIENQGVTSTKIAYDEKGDLKAGDITVYKVEKGQWTVLETVGGN